MVNKKIDWENGNLDDILGIPDIEHEFGNDKDRISNVLSGTMNIDNIRDDISVEIDENTMSYMFYYNGFLISVFECSIGVEQGEINIDFMGNINATNILAEDLLSEHQRFFGKGEKDIHINGLLYFTYKHFLDSLKSKGYKKVNLVTKVDSILSINNKFETEGIIKNKINEKDNAYILEI